MLAHREMIRMTIDQLNAELDEMMETLDLEEYWADETQEYIDELIVKKAFYKRQLLMADDDACFETMMNNAWKLTEDLDENLYTVSTNGDVYQVTES